VERRGALAERKRELRHLASRQFFCDVSNNPQNIQTTLHKHSCNVCP
jgi:hypothetical protein